MAARKENKNVVNPFDEIKKEITKIQYKLGGYTLTIDKDEDDSNLIETGYNDFCFDDKDVPNLIALLFTLARDKNIDLPFDIVTAKG